MRQTAERGISYQTAGSRLVCALSSNLECDIVWGIALDLESGCGLVVEVLVEELDKMMLARGIAFPELQNASYVVRGLGDICESWDGHDDGRWRIWMMN